MVLKDLTSNFIRCRIGNGLKAHFWHDNWTDLGPLIKYVGNDGPRLLRIPLNGHVIEATREGNWFLPGARSQRIQELQIKLLGIPAPSQERGQDIFEWKSATNVFSDKFSTAATWRLLRNVGQRLEWSSMVWFKQAVPRQAFTHWMIMQERLPTRDRLRRWNLIQDATCKLCGEEEESHRHLFFRCSYSSEVWTNWAGKLWNNPPDDLYRCQAWIASIPQTEERMMRTGTLIKALIQHKVYALWRERNCRSFNSTAQTPNILRAQVDQSMRSTLLSLQQGFESADNTLLQKWYFYTLPNLNEE
ncbi:PREDICTED: uncharacterized protein LOC104803385 [Tarenaya hassleriana]|uniref:uncharacterized protein LOC104803385 n=1 Tax=Tarenaya hassleriana TaxID=28532 RepID=UPI00053C2710|nr:PREDICTED: uncharacterized protein LOC104803385 [Tarenaya hassleriana]